jgi:hypothetical protein
MPPPTEIDFPNCVIKVNDSSNNSTILSPISIRLTDSSNNTLTQTPTSINFNNSTVYTEDTIRIKGVTGTPNQILSIDNSYNMVWKNNLAGWTGTATTPLNMNNYTIVGVSGILGDTISLGSDTSTINIPGVINSNYLIPTTGSLSIGNTGVTATIMGNVNIPTMLTLGNNNIFFGGNGGKIFTSTSNIQNEFGVTGRNITYTAVLQGGATSTPQIITLPLAKSGHYVYVINSSSNDWSISCQTGEFMVLGDNSSSTVNGTQVIAKNKTMVFYQTTNTIDGVDYGVNILVSETTTGIPNIDVKNSVLTLGGTNATGVTVGRTGQTTNIQGNLRIAGVTGTNGQVLTSNGTTATWAAVPASTWVGTATTTLNMNNLNMVGVSGISGNTINLNTNSLLLKGISGSSGQVLSVGATGSPEWRTINELTVSGTNIGAGTKFTSSLNNSTVVVGQYTNMLLAYNSDGTFGITLSNVSTNLEGFVIKYTDKGYIDWGTRISGLNNENINSVTFDKLNNIIIGANNSGGNLVLYNSDGSISGTITNTPNSYLIKYDYAGYLQWVAVVSTTNINSVAVDNDNNIIIGGRTNNTQVRLFNSNGATGFTMQTIATSGLNGYLAKYSDTGYAQWGNYITGNLDDSVTSVAVDKNNNIIVTGTYSSNSLSLYNANGVTGSTLPGIISAGDAFLAEYSSTGYIKWANNIRGTTGFNNSNSVSVDNNNDIIITGISNSLQTLLYNPNGQIGITLNNIFTGTNGLLAKYSDTGYVQWATKLAGNNNETMYSAKTDSKNNIYIVGIQNSSSFILYNANGATGITKTGSIGGFDGIVAKYSDTGYAQWGSNISGVNSDTVTTLSVDSDNNVIVGGHYNSNSITLYNSNNSVNRTLLNNTSNTTNNGFLIEYNDAGFIQWASNIETGNTLGNITLNSMATATTNVNNTAVGNLALSNLKNGYNNTTIGYNSGNSLLSGSNNIYIGNTGKSSESNVIRIGNEIDHANTHIASSNSINLQTSSLLLNGLRGSSGQVLSIGVTGSPEWKTITTPTPTLAQVMAQGNTSTMDLDMSGNNIVGVNTIYNNSLIIQSDTSLNLISPYIDITGQVVFSTPPHIPSPVLGNDAASKGYVDSLVGQYSGGFNLFLNYSQTSSNPTFKVLSQTVSSAVGQEVDITFTIGTQEVARFITEPLGITELPAGLFDAFIYGSVSGQGGDVHYSFQLVKYDSAGNSIPIITSGISPDVNSSPNNNPTSYSMLAPITSPVAFALTDRLAIILNVTKTGGGEVTLRTFFEGSYYSFVQSTLNAGTSLLSSNNTWTGTNNFILSPTAPTPSTDDNSTTLATTEFVQSKLSNFWGGNATTELNMNNNNITNALSVDANAVTLNIGTTTANGVTIGRSGQITDIQGNLQIGGAAGTNGQVLTSDGTTSTWADVPASTWVGTATTELNMNNFNMVGVSGISGNTINLNTNSLLLKGLSGSSGQVLTVGATGLEWKTITSNTTTPTLSQVMSQGNTASNVLNMNNFNMVGVSGISGNTINLNTNSLLLKGLSGSEGQVLSVGATGLEWKTITSNTTTPTLSQVMSQGNTASNVLNMNNFNMVGVSGISGNTINLNTNSLLLKGLSGSEGQVLSVGATGLEWKTITSNTTTPTLSQVMSQGNTASNVLNMNNFNIVGVSGISGNTINLNTNSLLLKGLSGSSGQVLTVGPTGLEWRSINELTVSGTNIGAGTKFTTNLNNNSTVVVGRFSNTLLAYNSNGTFGITLNNANTSDEGFIIKYNDNGYIDWATRVSGLNSENISSVNIDKMNNIIIGANNNSGNVTLYNSDGSIGSVIPSPTNNSFLIKYDYAGYVQWASVVSTTTIVSIAIDNDNNIIIGGRTNNVQVKLFNSNGATGFTFPTIAASGNNGYFAKYSHTGYAQWGNYVNGNLDDFVTSVAVDNKNNIIIAGYYSSNLLSLYNANGVIGSTLPGIISTADPFVAEYSSTGYIQWVNNIRGSVGTNVVNSVTVDSNNNIIITGYSASQSSLLYNNPNGQVGATINMSEGGSNGILAKYSDTGYVQWATKLCGTNTDVMYSVITDNKNNICISGIYASSSFILFNANGATGITKMGTIGAFDGIVAKYSDTGYAQWGSNIAGVNTETASTLSIDSDNNIMLGGYFTSNSITLYNSNNSVNSTLSNNTTNTTSNGFLIKYNDSGFIQWTSNIDGGTAGSIILNSVATIRPNLNNAALGNGALSNLKNGSNNIALGYNAGNSLVSGYNNIYIGNTGKSSESNVIRIGNEIDHANAIITSTNSINLQTNSLLLKGVTGSSGQVLTVGATGSPEWKTITLSHVLSGQTGSSGQVLSVGLTGSPEWRNINELTVLGTNIGAGKTIDSRLNNNSMVVVGQFTNTLLTVYNLDGTTGITMPNASILNEGFLIKYTDNGYVDWISRISGINNETVNYVAIDGMNNMIVGGNSTGNMVLYNSDGTVGGSLTISSVNAFLIKYDYAGYIQWATILNTSDIFTIATDNKNNIIVGGRTNIAQSKLFNPNGATGFTFPTIATSGYNGYLAKYSDTGYAQWGNYITGNLDEFVTSVAVDSNNNILITGYYLSNSLSLYNANGNTGATLPGVISQNDSFLAKYSDTGYIQWANNIYGTTNKNITNSVVVDSKNNIIIGGYYSVLQSLLYNPNGQVGATLTNTNTQNNGLLAKYSDTGYVQWATKIAGSGSDSINSLKIDSKDNIIIGGQHNSDSLILYNANGAASITKMGTIGGWDGMVAKYSDTGYAQWASNMGGNGNDVITTVSIDNDNSIFVGGYFNSNVLTIYNSNSTINSVLLNNTTNTNNNGFLIKYNDIGNVQWTSNIDGGTAGTVFVNSIAYIKNNNVNNTALGNLALTKLKNGYNNTSLGYNAGNSLVSGSNNIYIGNTGKPFDNNVIRIGNETDHANAIITSTNSINLQTNSLLLKGVTGSSGQVLTVGATGSPEWKTIISINSTTPTLSQVMSQGNTASTTLNMSNYDIIGVSGISGNTINLNINSLLLKGLSGSSGQVLTVGATGLEWKTITSINSTTPTLAQVMSQGNTASTTLNMSNFNIVGVSGISGNTINLNTNVLLLNGLSGTTGQVLSISATGPVWSSLSTLTTPTLAQVMTQGNNASSSLNMNNFNIVGVSGISGNTINLNTNSLLLKGLPGTTGQVISIGATGPVWRSTNELVVKDTNIGAGTSVLNNINPYTNQYIYGEYDTGPVDIYNSNGNTGIILPSITNTPAKNMYIVKYNNGIAQWATFVNTTINTGIFLFPSIAIDSLNNTYVTSLFGSTMYAYNAPGNTYTVSLNWTSGTESCIVKYNDNGIAQWATKLNPSICNIDSVIVDKNDNIVVTGRYNATSLIIYDAPGNTSHLSLSKIGTYDMFIIKYNSNGYALWAKHIGNPGHNFNSVNFAAIDNSNNIIVDGIYTSNALTLYNDNTNSASTKILTNATPLGSPNRSSFFVVKYNDSTALWAAQIGASGGPAISSSVYTDSANNIIVPVGVLAGQIVNIQNSDGNTSSINLSIPTVRTLYLIKYSDTGYVQWATKIENIEPSRFNMVTDKNDIYVILGTTDISVTTFDVSGNTCVPSTLPTSNITRTLLVKYNSNGIAQWRMNFNQISSNITLSVNDSYVYLSGTTPATPVTIFNSNQTIGITLYNKRDINRIGFAVTCSKDGFVQYANILDSYAGGHGPHRIVTNNINTSNTSFGNYSLSNLSTGNNNTALGYNAGNNLISGYNNIYIGNKGNSYENNTIRIGNSTDHSDAVITSTNSINFNTKSLLLNGFTGNTGQILSIGASGPVWSSLSTLTTPTLSAVMSQGNNASTSLNMGGNSITNTTSLDANAVTLNIGTSTANGVTVGRSGQTTNIQGNLQIAGATGSSGQVLTSNGTTATWAAAPSSTWIGTATTSLNMNNFNIIGVSGISGNTINLNTNSLLLNGVTGSSGQVLTVGATGSPEWKTITSTPPTLSQVMSQGNTASTSLNMGGTSITNATSLDANDVTLNIGTTTANGVTVGRSGQTTNIQGNLQIAGATGSSGQVLTSNGTTATWEAVPASTWVGTATTSLNMNNFNIFGVSGISGNTINLNTDSLLLKGVSGSSGQVLSVTTTGSPEWKTMTLGVVMLEGNTAFTTLNMNNFNIVDVSGISGNTINLNTDSLLLNGSSGSQGQVLSVSTTGSPEWASLGSLATPSLYEVMRQGNSASTSLNMNNFNIVGVSGISGNTVNLQTNSLLLKGLSGSSGQVLSVGASGSPEWRNTYELVVKDTNIGAGTNVFDNINANTSQYIIGGYSTGPITIYNSDGNTFTTLPLVTNSPASNIYIVKYTNGIPQWATFVNSKIPNSNQLPCIAIDSMNNTYVTNAFSSTLYAYDAPGNTYTVRLNWTSGELGFIVKYNDTGVAQWGTNLSSLSYINSVVVDKNNDLIVTGRYSSASLIIYDAPGNTFHINMTKSGSYNMFIIKYNSNGYALWAKHIGLTVSIISYAVIDNLNNIIVSGIYDTVGLTIFNDNTNTITASTKTLINPTPTKESMFIVKYNDTAAMWATQIGSNGFVYYPTIQTDTANNIIASVGVNANNKLTIQNSDGNTSSINLPSSTDTYMAIVKYNSDGIAQWATKIENIALNDNRFNIECDNQDVYAVVSTNAGFGFNPTIFDVSGNSCVPTTLPGVNLKNIVVKYNSNGIAQWRMNFNQACFNFNVTINDSYIYVSGQSTNTPLTIYNSDQSIGIILYNKVSIASFSFVVRCSKNGFVQYASIIDDVSDSSNTIHKITTNNNNTNNTAFGNGALQKLVSGNNNNIALGYNAGNNLIYGSNNIYIGNTGNSYDNNTIRIGNSTDHTDAVITSTNSINLQTNSLLLNGNDGTTGQVLSLGASGYPEWRTTNELVVKNTNIGVGTNVFNKLTSTNLSYIYVIGSFLSEINTWPLNLTSTNNYEKTFVIKYNDRGDVIWANKIEGVMSNVPLNLVLDNSNNIYVSGFYDAPITISGQSGSTISLSNSGTETYDCFIVKYNDSGNILWANKLGGNLYDVPLKMVVDSLNNVYVTGYYQSNLFNISDTNGTITLGNSGSGTEDGFVVKYNSNGTILWASKISGTLDDRGSDLSIDSLNNIYVTGYYASNSITINRVTGPSSTITLTNSGSATLNTFIIKYDTNGNIIWVNIIGGTLNESPQKIKVDSSTNVYVTGVYESNPLTIGGTSLGNSGLSDIFIIKYNSNGNTAWANRISGFYTDSPKELIIDNLNNVYVTGNYASKLLTISGQNGSSTTITNEGNPSGGSYDSFIIKYNSNGTIVWVNKIGAYGDYDGTTNLNIDSSNNIYVTGYYNSQFILNISGQGGSTTINSTISERQTYIVKYNSNGNILWVNKIYGNSVLDTPIDLSIDSSNNVYVTGYYASNPITIYGNNNDTIDLINTDAYNSYIVKYNSSGIIIWANRIGGGGVVTTKKLAITPFVSTTDNINNITSGDYSLSNLISGNNNIVLGYTAGSNLIQGSNNIYIGDNNEPIYENNTIRLGNSNMYNNINIGNNTSFTNINGEVNINSSNSRNINIGTSTYSGTVTVGNVTTEVLLNLNTKTNINGTTNINTEYSLYDTNIGTGTNMGTITIGNSYTPELNIGKAMKPTYPITTNGTNIVGTIGYVKSGDLVNNAGTLTAGQEYNMGSTIITEGVWYVSCTIGYRVNTGTSNIQQTELWLATSAVDNDWTGQLGGGNVVSVRTSYLSTSGLWYVATGGSGTLRIKFKVHYTGGTVIQENSRWAYQLVRIA